MAGEVFDYPNKQAVGLDPPWVEGTGGSGGGETPQPTGRQAETKSGQGPDLDSLNKQEMLEFARQLGVSPANNDMTKDELRAGIDEKLAEGK